MTIGEVLNLWYACTGPTKATLQKHQEFIWSRTLLAKFMDGLMRGKTPKPVCQNGCGASAHSIYALPWQKTDQHIS